MLHLNTKNEQQYHTACTRVSIELGHSYKKKKKKTKAADVHPDALHLQYVKMSPDVITIK